MSEHSIRHVFEKDGILASQIEGYHERTQQLEMALAIADAIEHNTQLIEQADWIIDIGPEGGDGGGEIVATGTPAQIAANERSITGRYLTSLATSGR